MSDLITFEMLGCPVHGRMIIARVNRRLRKASRFVVSQRRNKKQGNHRGKYYRKLNRS